MMQWNKATRKENAFDSFAPDSSYARQFRIKREIMRTLSGSMAKEQKDWLDEYSIADKEKQTYG